MNPRWIDIFGLLLCLSGAILLANGLMISRKQALSIGVSRVADDSDEVNVGLPHVQNKLREARFARIGMILLVIGFLLQIVAAWMQ